MQKYVKTIHFRHFPNDFMILLENPPSFIHIKSIFYFKGWFSLISLLVKEKLDVSRS
jgi:hypothetical protein